VSRRNGTQLGRGLGQRDVETGIPQASTFEQELQCKSRLARAGRPFDQVDPACRKTAGQDLVEAGNAG